MRSRLGAVAACLALAGCAKGPPEITTLSGRVTVDGKPVKSGVVNVVSEDDVVRTGGEIAADGTYRIVGAPVGPVKLSVSTEDFRVVQPEPGAGVKPRPNPLYVATPKKYETFDTAGLATTVPRGEATYDIELTSK
ncbi:MAG: hypothetical protein C0501_07000 [Isosphaera sp.]|nr:hypothetical protein [Isosphaera sp.]